VQGLRHPVLRLHEKRGYAAHWSLKGRGGYRVCIRRGDHGTPTPVKEVGPWNSRYDYWQIGCEPGHVGRSAALHPEARAAYYDNSNKGEDQCERNGTNPAGADLRPRVARRLGPSKYQNAWVYVRYATPGCRARAEVCPELSHYRANFSPLTPGMAVF